MRKKKVHINDLTSDSTSACLNHTLIFRYVEGSLSRNEVKKVEKHLNLCTFCFLEMASLVRESLSPMDMEEKSAISNIEKLSPAEQVSRILAYQEQGHDFVKKYEQRRILGTVSIWNDALKKLVAGLAYCRQKFRPAMAVIALFFLVVGVFYGTTYLMTEYPIRKAQRLLKDNYRIFIENPRLSGGYSATGISMLMSAGEAPPPYLETARNNLLKAVQHGSKSTNAIRLLAQIYLIEKKYIKADSLLGIIVNEPGHMALVFNDLGVLYSEQKNWGKAAIYFQSAIDADNQFLDAYYNLALMKIELGSTDESISLLTAYIRREPNEVWKNAAQHILEKIERKDDTG